RPARRVRRRRSRLAALYSLLATRHSAIEQTLWLLVGGLLVLSVWASPRMQPRALIVHGAPPAAQQPIETRLRQLWQKQPYSIRLGARALENELQRFGWVARVQVRPQFPDRLHLHIEPRRAFVEVRTNPIPYPQPPIPNSQFPIPNPRIFVDPAGIAFQPPNPPERASGGVILLSRSASLPTEGALSRGSLLWRAFELLRALSQQDQPARYVRTVRVEPDGTLSLTCQAEGGALMQFRLGDAVLYQQQAQVIQLLLSCSPAQAAQWEYIDLKSPFHPAVKPRSDGSHSSSDLSHLSDGSRTR
ncbi:MAG: FtsQ-type POTRA domain-containing protein, partial [Fimbriimonadales bacterium]|nr:FtsQ-type POTRA domain-containing protein [Fimbriimonadales bacterium]